MYGLDVADQPVHMLCPNLKKTTKVVLQRINRAQQSTKSNRQDNDNRINEWEPALNKINDGVISTDLNDKRKTDNDCEKIAVVRQSCNEEDLYEDDRLTKNQLTFMNANRKYTKRKKRKLPPLKIPKERILFHNNNGQDDITPEYPLKEGYVFFNHGSYEKESFKSHTHTKTTEQNRNVFSDFPAAFSSPEASVLKTSRETKVHRNGDNKDMRLQRATRRQRASMLENEKLARDVSELSRSKLSEPEAQPTRIRLYLKSLTDESDNKYEAESNNSGPQSSSFARDVSGSGGSKKCDNGSHNFQIKNNIAIQNNTNGITKVVTRDSSGVKKGEIKRSTDVKNVEIKNSNDGKQIQIKDRIGNKNVEIMLSSDGKKFGFDIVQDEKKNINVVKKKNAVSKKVDLNGSRHIVSLSSVTEQTTSYCAVPNSHGQSLIPALVQVFSDNVSTDICKTVHLNISSQFENEHQVPATKRNTTSELKILENLSAADGSKRRKEIGLEISSPELGNNKNNDKNAKFKFHDESMQLLEDAEIVRNLGNRTTDSTVSVKSEKMYNSSNSSTKYVPCLVLDEFAPSEHSSHCDPDHSDTNKMYEKGCNNVKGNNHYSDNSYCDIVSNMGNLNSITGLFAYGQNNQSVNALDWEVRNNNQVRSQVKLSEMVPSSNERKLSQPSIRESGNVRGIPSDTTSQFQNWPFNKTELLFVTQEKRSSASITPTENGFSADDNNDKEQGQFSKRVSSNLEHDMHTMENVHYLNTRSEIQTGSLAPKNASKLPSSGHLDNDPALCFYSKARVASEISTPDEMKQTNSLYLPDPQIKTFRNNKIPLSEGYCKSRTSDMQHNSANGLTGIGSLGHSAAMVELHSIRNIQTSDNCFLSVVRSKDQKCEQSVSQIGQPKQDPTISTKKISHTDSFKAHVRNSDSDVKVKSSENSLARDHKQHYVSEINLSDVSSLSLSSKRRIYTGVQTMPPETGVETTSTSTGLDDFYGTVKAATAEHQIPWKKLKRKECDGGGQLLDRACNDTTNNVMATGDNVHGTAMTQNLSPTQHKCQFPSDSSVSHRIPTVTSPPKQKSQNHTAAQTKTSSTLTRMILGDKFNPTLSKYGTVEVAKGLMMENQISLTVKNSLIREEQCKLRNMCDPVPGVTLSPRKDAPLLIHYLTRKHAEDEDCINGYAKNEKQTSQKLQLFPPLLTHHCHDLTVVSQVSTNARKQSSGRSHGQERHLPFLSSSPHALTNMSPRSVLQPIKGSTDHHQDSEVCEHYSKKMSNQTEKSVMKSKDSNGNSSYSQSFGGETNVTYHHVHTHRKRDVGFQNSSFLAQPCYDPLWGPVRPHHRPIIHVTDGLVPFHIPFIPLERKVASSSSSSSISHYNNQLTIPSQMHYVNVHHRPVVSVISENSNMLRHAHAIKIAQQSNVTGQTVEPAERFKYPSWVQIPHEKACSSKCSTSTDTSRNSDLVANCNSQLLCETISEKLQQSVAPITPAHCTHVQDSLPDSISFHCGEDKFSTENGTVGTDGRTGDQSPPCEPLDLSQHSETGQNLRRAVSLQSDSNGKQIYGVLGNKWNQSSTLHAFVAPYSMHRPHSAELHDPHVRDKHSFRLLSHVSTNGSSQDLVGPGTHFLTLPRTNSTSSLPASLSPMKSSVTLYKCPLLETALQYNIVPEEGNVHPFNGFNTKPSISQESCSCDKNEQRLSTHTTNLVVNTDGARNTSTQLDDYAALATHIPNTSVCETTELASSSETVSLITTHSSSTEPINVCSTPDLTDSVQSIRCVSSENVKKAAPLLSLSLTTIGQRCVTNSNIINEPPASGNTSNDSSNSAHTASPRVVPLPIKDFFTHSPRENTYSSLLMAQITSQKKRLLGLERFTEFCLTRNRDRGDFEINNNLQGNLVIDLTEGGDDCDVVSISSKDSLDDDSRTDFLDVTMEDRVPGRAHSSVSDDAMTEGSKDLPAADISSGKSNTCINAQMCPILTGGRGLDHVSLNTCSSYTEKTTPVPTHIVGMDIFSPDVVDGKCQAYNKRCHTDNLAFDETEFSCRNIPNVQEITEANVTNARLLSQTSAPTTLTHPVCHLNDSRKTSNSNPNPAVENSIPSSHLLKIIPEVKDIMARKLRNAVASRSTSEQLLSEDLMLPMATSFTQNVDIETDQSQNTHHLDKAQPVSANINVRDNSTQRAAATLLELSTNPLYNTYMISPETSDIYQEKVYQIHAILEDSEAETEDMSQKQCDKSSHGTHRSQNGVSTAAQKSGPKTSRRVGRPLKEQYNAPETPNSDQRNSSFFNPDSCNVSTSNSRPSAVTNPFQDANSFTTQVHSSSTYISVNQSRMFYEPHPKPALLNMTHTVPSSVTLSMSHMINHGLNGNLSHQTINGLDTATPPHFLNTSAQWISALKTRMPETLAPSTVSGETSVQISDQLRFGDFSKVPYLSPTNNLNIATTLPGVSLSGPVSLNIATNTFPLEAENQTSRDGSHTAKFLVNTVRCISPHRHERASLEQTSTNSWGPLLAATSNQSPDVPSSYAALPGVGAGAHILSTIASHVYNHTASIQSDTGKDLRYTGHNTDNDVPSDKRSDHISSRLKRTTETTENQNGKRQRNSKQQEKVMLTELSSIKLPMGMNSLLSNVGSPRTLRSKPAFQRTHTDSPTSQLPLYIVTDSCEANMHTTKVPYTELCNNPRQSESRSKGKKNGKARKGRQKRNTQQKTNSSDIDDVLQQLNSNVSAENIVVSTSFENDIHVLSLRSEEDGDFCQQGFNNDDQIVPVNIRHVSHNSLQSDTKGKQRNNFILNGKTGRVDSKPLQQKTAPPLTTSEELGIDSSAGQFIKAGYDLFDIQDPKEIEKEKAVTYLLAEMMYSKFKGSVP